MESKDYVSTLTNLLFLHSNNLCKQYYSFLAIFSFLMIRNKFSLSSGSQSCEYIKDFGFGSSYTFFIPSTFVFGPNVSLPNDFNIMNFDHPKKKERKSKEKRAPNEQTDK